MHRKGRLLLQQFVEATQQGAALKSWLDGSAASWSDASTWTPVGADGLLPAHRAPLSRPTAALVGPDYRFELVADAGHFLPEQAPDVVTHTLLDWLGGVAPVA